MSIFRKKKLFGPLYEEHKDDVFTYIFYRCGRDRMLAEDLASAVFLKAFDRFDIYDETQASFRTWIFTITRNSIIDHYRKKKELALPEDELPEAMTDDDEFYVLLDQEYDMRIIERCMEGVSHKQRLCIEERFLRGIATTAIAVKHEMSRDAVEKNITRGLHAVRDCVHSK